MLGPLSPKHSSVLVVEDNPDDALLATKALQTFGIKTIYHAETAEDALSFLNKHSCDAVLIDYNLPGINGLRLLEHLREAWPQTPVIIVTGARDERVAVSALKLGAADYLPKDELLTSGIIRTLQAVLREQVASREHVQREVLSSSADRLQVALGEADWLVDTVAATASRGGDGGGVEYGEEGWQDVRDAFSRYLQAAFRRFPDPATTDEQGLIRMFAERGSSPAEALGVYRATLRSLALEQTQAPFDPIVCLVRVFAGLIEQCQVQMSVDAVQRSTA